jgi:hypothetical protein
MGYVPLRCRLLITIAKLSAAKPIVATRPLPTGRNRTGAIDDGSGSRLLTVAVSSGLEAATLNPAAASLDHAAATGMVTTLAGCGIKNVVTTRATSVII